MNDRSNSGFGGLDMASQLWIKGHIDSLRRDYETHMQDALISLIEAADDAHRLCVDQSFASLTSAWQDGIKALHGKLLHRLTELGVTSIDTIGRKVDPRLHHVAEVITASFDSETIVREELPGFLWNDHVLRIARVVSVARPEDLRS